MTKRFLQTWGGIWIVLFFLFLPFSFYLLPNTGSVLSTFLHPLIRFTGDLFGTSIDTVNLESDSTYLWGQLFILFIIAFITTTIITNIKAVRFDRLQLILHTTVAYILALYLLKYGLDKLFKFQFYDAEPNTLFTPVGQLSKDILFWTSMGSSHSYNIFMGIIEIIPALLLLSSKTRTLGALISFGVLLNVLAINFGFDITVKLLSSMLVFASFYLLLPQLKRLFEFFSNQTVLARVVHTPLIERKLIKRSIKGIIVAIILCESLLPFINYGLLTGDNQEKIAFWGSYEIDEWEGDYSFLSMNEIKRIHVHNQGYLILETTHGDFIDYKVKTSPFSLDIKGITKKFNFKVHTAMDEITFVSNDAEHPLSFTTHKIDLSQLPYQYDSFHWTVDGFNK